MVDERIKKLFTECQLLQHGFPILLKEMMNIFDQMNYVAFKRDFVWCMKRVMIEMRRDTNVERAIDFISKFCAEVTLSSSSENKENTQSEVDDEDGLDLVPFTSDILCFLLDSQSARSKAVRFRACQLIEKILSNLGENVYLDDDIFKRIQTEMLDSLYDKCHAVRVHAALSIRRVQDPEDVNCPVVQTYMRILMVDPNVEVRKAVLTSIVINEHTLKTVLDKTLDVAAIMRKKAFQIIAEKISVKALKIVQRVTLLRRGINDRSPLVKDTCINVLAKEWLTSYNGDILKLLSALFPQHFEEECSAFLTFWMKKMDINDLQKKFIKLDNNSCMPLDSLTPEAAFYWLTLCKYIAKTSELENLSDKVVPTPLNYIAYLHKLVEHVSGKVDEEKSDWQYILLQAINIMKFLDTCDTAGRQAVIDCIKKMLLKIDIATDEIVCSLVECLMQLHSKNDNESVLSWFGQVVEDVIVPVFQEEVIMKDIALQKDLQVKLAELKVKLVEEKDVLEECVRNEDFNGAALKKKSVDELEQEIKHHSKQLEIVTHGADKKDEQEEDDNDADVSQRKVHCLRIYAEVLKSKRFDKLTPSVLAILDNYILPAISSKNDSIRKVAFECLGLCCVRSVQKARMYMVLFIQVLLHDTEEVKVEAVKSIINILLFFGLPILVKEDNKDEDDEDEDGASEAGSSKSGANEEDVWNKLFDILTHFLDSEAGKLRSVTCEGFCKLLMCNRVSSSGLFTRLLLFWYSPVTEDDPKLRHLLGVFFTTYAQESRANRDLISEAFLPTIKLLVNAPTASPLSSIKVENVTEMLIHLTDKDKLKGLLGGDETAPRQQIIGTRPHDELAISICNELLKNLKELEVKLYARSLSLLNISLDNKQVLTTIRNFLKKIFKAHTVKDKSSLRSLLKTSKEIKLALQNGDPNLDLSQLELDEQVLASGSSQTSATVSDMPCSAETKDDDDDNNNDDDDNKEDDAKDGTDSDIVESSDDDFINNTNNNKKKKNNFDEGSMMDETLKADTSKKSSKITDDNDADDDDDFEETSFNRKKKQDKIQEDLNTSRRSLKRKQFTAFSDDEEDDAGSVVESDDDDDFEETPFSRKKKQDKLKEDLNTSRRSLKRKQFTAFSDDEDEDDVDAIVESDDE